MQKEILSGVTDTHLKLDPRTKIIVTIITNIVLLGGGIVGVEMITRVVLASIPALLLTLERKYKTASLYSIFFILAAISESIILQKTAGILNLIILITSGTISRFMPSLVMGYYLVTTTTVSEFVASMERMHVTKKIIIPMSVMFRFFPTIVEETLAINDAMKMRGIGKGGRVKNPLVILEYKIVPLMMSVVKIGDELSAASLTKGLGSPIKRTNICEIGFKYIDFILLSIALICFLLFAIY